jgi:outer membrane biogenesis lipoprotein LolB
MPFGDHGEVHMRPRLASSLLIALFLLAGCASSTSVRSSGSENGSRSQMIFGLPF